MPSPPIRHAALALVFALSAAPALADTASAVTCSDNAWASPTACSRTLGGPPPALFSSTTAATASASHGALKVWADASGRPAVQTGASAWAEFSDTLLIAAAEPGHSGTALVRFGTLLAHQSTQTLGDFSGIGDLAASGIRLRLEAIGLDAPWHVMTEELDFTTVRRIDADTVETNHAIQPLAPFAFDVTLGQPFRIRAWLVADAVVAGNAQATADAGHSFYWGGLVSVTDADGQAIGYTLSSASGTDWSQSFAPVPEAGTSALLLAGLALVLVAAARRGQADGHGTIPALPDLQAGPACKPCPHKPIRSPSTTSTSPCRPS
jgi:hypothetical protein